VLKLEAPYHYANLVRMWRPMARPKNGHLGVRDPACMNFDGRLASRLASASVTDSLLAHHARQYQVPVKLGHGQAGYWQACVARIARQL
jgi:hypothetical protein